MSGMLNGGGLDPSQLMMMLNQGRNDPFSKPLPGTQFLGDGGMAAPGQMQQQPPGMPGQEQMPQGQGQGMPPLPPVGLPNLPQSFEGQGMGQFAPKETQGDPIRQQLIRQLLQMMSQNGGSGMGGGF